jgi:Leu/Phe-tRNA-protein transferase
MERHNALDMRDQALEAMEMKLALKGESEFMRIPDTTKVALQSIADKVEQSELTMENIKTFNPSIAEAVAALNPKLQNLGKEKKAAA